MKFTSVAFDLDGTLYPEYRLNVRLVPFLLKDQRLLRAMGKARDQIRRYLENSAGGNDLPGGGAERAATGRADSGGKLSTGSEAPAGNGTFTAANKAPEGSKSSAVSKVSALTGSGGANTGVFWEDFYELQAALMGEILRRPPDEIREKTERLIYRGWEPLFRKIRLFPYVRETLEVFREKGIRLGLLSDFPPENKLKNLKIDGYWHTVLCSERTGRLKPDSAPFLELAKRMETPPEDILYVGNSVSYDAEGALLAGMNAALIRPRRKKALPPHLAGKSAPRVFVFHDYRQLRDYVLS